MCPSITCGTIRVLPVVHKTYELKVGVQNGIELPGVDFPVPKSVNSMCY
jgi:hypothetical protein